MQISECVCARTYMYVNVHMCVHVSTVSARVRYWVHVSTVSARVRSCVLFIMQACYYGIQFCGQ